MVLQIKSRFEFRDFDRINDYLALLFQAMSGRIDAIICRAVHNPSDREDVRQEACKMVLENAAKFLDCADEPHRINLLLRIVRFSCVNYMRRIGRRIKTRNSIELLEAIHAPEQEIDLEGAIEEVRKALHRLAHSERMVLRLRYFEKLSRGDIADVLDMSKSRVKNLLRRALRRLRFFLATFS